MNSSNKTTKRKTSKTKENENQALPTIALPSLGEFPSIENDKIIERLTSLPPPKPVIYSDHSGLLPLMEVEHVEPELEPLKPLTDSTNEEIISDIPKIQKKHKIMFDDEEEQEKKNQTTTVKRAKFKASAVDQITGRQMNENVISSNTSNNYHVSFVEDKKITIEHKRSQDEVEYNGKIKMYKDNELCFNHFWFKEIKSNSIKTKFSVPKPLNGEMTKDTYDYGKYSYLKSRFRDLLYSKESNNENIIMKAPEVDGYELPDEIYFDENGIQEYVSSPKVVPIQKFVPPANYQGGPKKHEKPMNSPYQQTQNSPRPNYNDYRQQRNQNESPYNNYNSYGGY